MAPVCPAGAGVTTPGAGCAHAEDATVRALVARIIEARERRPTRANCIRKSPNLNIC